jgi:copper chaperone CopZ
MSTQTFTVTGMTCGHCVNSVTEEISEIKGVTSVVVELESGLVTVEAESEIDRELVVAAVTEAGYTVTA